MPMLIFSNPVKMRQKVAYFYRTVGFIVAAVAVMCALTGCVGLTGAKTSSASETSASAQTYTMSGKLAPNAGGAGAVVRITGSASQTVAADASGNFSFSSLPTGSQARQSPSNTGYAFRPVAMTVTMNSADVSAISFTAVADPTTFTISGIAGTPGATVTLSGASSASTTADASGNFSFCRYAQRLLHGHIRARADSTSALRVRTPTSVAPTLPFPRSPPRPSRKRSQSPAPSAAAERNGANVTLSGASSASTTANSSGSYTFTGLSNGSYAVTASHAGFTFSPTSQNATVSGANVTGDGATAVPPQTSSISAPSAVAEGMASLA